MSVIWYDDDAHLHTLTTMENAPEEFNFTIIPPGGFADFTFTKPGIYDYYDKLFPAVKGRIIVGDLIEVGENIIKRIGGNIPFNYTELQRIVFSIINYNATHNSISISESTISTITYGPEISKPITGTFHIQEPYISRTN